MSRSAEIRAALKAAFGVQHLEVINESGLHSGHSGDDGSGESHFRVVIRAPEFGAMNRLARHRAVHGALGAELIGKIHALALEIDG
jgi:BolA protein